MKKYSYKYNIDSYEFSKLAKIFPKYYLLFLTYGTLINIILSFIIYVTTSVVLDILIMFLLVEIAITIYFKIKINVVAKLFFRFNRKSLLTNYKIEFYDTYFILNDNKYLYDEIDKTIETDTNFYLEKKNMDDIFIVPKNECDFDLIVFLRKEYEKLNKLDNHLGDQITFKNRKKYS